MVISFLSTFLLFVAISIYTGYTYGQKTMAFVKSEEFQMMAKNNAELMAKTYGNTVSGAAKGLNEGLDDEVIIALASKSAVITGKIIQTTAAALDSTVGKTKILTDQSVGKASIEIGHAGENYQDTLREINLFLDFKKEFKGNLVLTSYDIEGKKMDLCSLKLDKKKNDAELVSFKFKHTPDTWSSYYILTTE